MAVPVYPIDISDASILSGSGFQGPQGPLSSSYEIRFYALQGTGTPVLLGFIYDNQNTYTDQSAVTKSTGLKVEIHPYDTSTINIPASTSTTGEYALSITYDTATQTGLTLTIYIPDIQGATSPVIFYIDKNGIAYWDEELTQPATQIAQFEDDIDIGDSSGTEQEVLILSDLLAIRDDSLNIQGVSFQETLREILDSADFGEGREYIDTLGISDESALGLVRELVDRLDIKDIKQFGVLWSLLTGQKINWRQL